MKRRILCLAAVALLAGCATAPRPRHADPAAFAAQQAREARLAAEGEWALSGRLAISDGKDSGSGRIDWHERGDRFRIELSAPVSRRSWRLSGHAGGALLEGLEGGPRRADDADELLAQALGWKVPLALLRAWVRGARGPGRAELEFGAGGLPVAMRQSGWEIDFRDWYRDRPLPLPRRVFASRGELRVRLVVDEWQEGAGALAGGRP